MILQLTVYVWCRKYELSNEFHQWVMKVYKKFSNTIEGQIELSSL